MFRRQITCFFFLTVFSLHCYGSPYWPNVLFFYYLKLGIFTDERRLWKLYTVAGDFVFSAGRWRVKRTCLWVFCQGKHLAQTAASLQTRDDVSSAPPAADRLLFVPPGVCTYDTLTVTFYCLGTDSLFLYFLKVLKHDLEEYIFPPIRPLREFVSCLGIHHLTYCIS